MRFVRLKRQRCANLVGPRAATWRSSIAGRSYISTLYPDRSRVRRPQGRHHRHRGNRRPCREAGNLDYPDRFRAGVGPAWKRSRHEPGAPGGNVTGLSTQSSETASKRSKFCARSSPVSAVGGGRQCQLCPSVEEMREVVAVAHTLGVEVDRLEIPRAEDIAPAFEQLKSGAGPLRVHRCACQRQPPSH